MLLTQILVEYSYVLELDVEIPSSTEGTHGRLLPVALPADHADLRAIRTIRECTGYAKDRDVNCRSPKVLAYLVFRFRRSARRFYHLIFPRPVDPKLKAARFRLSRFMDGHFSMDNCETTLSGFDRELCCI